MQPGFACTCCSADQLMPIQMQRQPHAYPHHVESNLRNGLSQAPGSYICRRRVSRRVTKVSTVRIHQPTHEKTLIDQVYMPAQRTLDGCTSTGAHINTIRKQALKAFAKPLSLRLHTDMHICCHKQPRLYMLCNTYCLDPNLTHLTIHWNRDQTTAGPANQPHYNFLHMHHSMIATQDVASIITASLC